MGHNSPFPQYRTLWKKITDIAKSKYNTRLTSHYFRRRFETIAEKINAEDMNPNHWTILMGDKPEHGHMPDVYSMTDDDDPILDEFADHLAPRLSLTEEAPNTQSTSKISQLLAENQKLNQRIADLTEQIIGLTKLLTQKPT